MVVLEQKQQKEEEDDEQEQQQMIMEEMADIPVRTPPSSTLVGNNNNSNIQDDNYDEEVGIDGNTKYLDDQGDVVFVTAVTAADAAAAADDDDDDGADDDVASKRQQDKKDALQKKTKKKKKKQQKASFTNDIKESTIHVQKKQQEGIETIIHDVTKAYPGDSIQDSVDDLIMNNAVVMFEKTWCLFSSDAKDFLLSQLQVNVTTVPIDICQHGVEINNHLCRTTNHKTVPYIFIKGDFLGGFEEVNALYSKGQLHQEYLRGLSQADMCNMQVQSYTKSSKDKPYFWFPHQVNAYVVRMSAILTFIMSLICLIVTAWWQLPLGPYIAYGIFIDFILRAMAGAFLSPIARLAIILVGPFLEPKLRMGRPKQFADFCGVLLSFIASVLYSIPFPGHLIIGSLFMGLVVLGSGFAGFFDYCVGCVLFKMALQMGLLSK